MSIERSPCREFRQRLCAHAGPGAAGLTADAFVPMRGRREVVRVTAVVSGDAHASRGRAHEDAIPRRAIGTPFAFHAQSGCGWHGT
jgi:hypothetical protein